jgi:hypothetical protein
LLGRFERFPLNSKTSGDELRLIALTDTLPIVAVAALSVGTL